MVIVSATCQIADAILLVSTSVCSASDLVGDALFDSFDVRLRSR